MIRETKSAFWKFVYVLLIVLGASLGFINFSMFYWPTIPSSPKPSEGRIYSFNNHGKHTYMNRQEFLIRRAGDAIVPLAVLAAVAIGYFIDPFDQKGRALRYRRPRAISSRSKRISNKILKVTEGAANASDIGAEQMLDMYREWR